MPGEISQTDSGPSDLAPPPIIMFALSKLVFKFLFLGVLTVIALAVLAAIVSPTTTTSEKSPAQHATENKAAPVVEVAAITWEQYLADCGLKAQEVNEARSAQLFAEKYRGRLIRWSGTVVSTSEGFWGRYSLLVLMSPTESAFGTSDLSLEAPLGMKNTILSLNTDLWPQLFSDVSCIALWISSEKILTRLYSVLHWFHKRLEANVKKPRENRCFQTVIVFSFSSFDNSKKMYSIIENSCKINYCEYFCQ